MLTAVDRAERAAVATRPVRKVCRDPGHAAQIQRMRVAYENFFLWHFEETRPEEILGALDRALEVAEATGAATLIPQILCDIAYLPFVGGEVEEGFRLLDRVRSDPAASRDPEAALTLAIYESGALLSVGKLEDATRVALRGIEAARHGGMESSLLGAGVVAEAIEGLLGTRPHRGGSGADRPADRRIGRPGPLATAARVASGDRPAARRGRRGGGAAGADQAGDQRRDFARAWAACRGGGGVGRGDPRTR
jgi:hypothetical protein